MLLPSAVYCTVHLCAGDVNCIVVVLQNPMQTAMKPVFGGQSTYGCNPSVAGNSTAINRSTSSGARTTGQTPPPAAQPCCLETFPLYQELLQEVLQRVPSSSWPAVRLINRRFEAALSPLMDSITIRAWATSCKPLVASSSSLIHVQRLTAVVDTADDLGQLVQLLEQLPNVSHLCLRGLKPLAGLLQLHQVAHSRARQHSRLQLPTTTATNQPAMASLSAAMAGVTRLDLPDSSSSSLPAGVQLPDVTAMGLYAVDSTRQLAAFAPNLQRLECFSLSLCPASQSLTNAPGGSSPRGSSGGSSGTAAAAVVLPACQTLLAQFVSGSSPNAVVAGLASVLPELRELLVVPQLQQPEEQPFMLMDGLQQCKQLTLEDLKQALPRLRREAAAKN